jgi:peptidoglycan/LPS O-acetylase OafA/YrhL
VGAAAESEARIYQAGEARLASMESLRALAALAVLVAHVFGVASQWRPAIYDGLVHRTVLGGGFAVFGESFSRHTVATVDGPMWSLVVELHFYLLLPVLAAGIRLIARRSFARAGFVLAVLALAGLAMRFALVLHPAHHDPRWEYSLPTTFVFFVSGLALALVRVNWDGGTPASLRGPLRNGNAWLLGSVPLWLLTFWRYDLDVAAAVASFLVVGAAGLPLRRGRLVRCLDWRPLALPGTASYSLYLWHLPIVQQVAGAGWSPTGFLPLLAILVPICIVAALVSYAAIEEPFLRLRLRRSWSGRSRPAPAPVEVPAGVVTPAVEVI